MNLASLTSIFRHWLTAAAGVLGLWLIASLAITGEEGKQLTDALGQLIEPMVAIIGLIVVALSRLAITWLGKLFGRGAGEIGDKLNGIPVWLGIAGTAAAVVGSLPSCSALSGIPYKFTAQVEEGALSYSSKGGIEMEYRAGYGQMPERYKHTPSWLGRRSHK